MSKQWGGAPICSAYLGNWCPCSLVPPFFCSGWEISANWTPAFQEEKAGGAFSSYPLPPLSNDRQKPKEWRSDQGVGTSRAWTGGGAPWSPTSQIDLGPHREGGRGQHLRKQEEEGTHGEIKEEEEEGLQSRCTYEQCEDVRWDASWYGLGRESF